FKPNWRGIGDGKVWIAAYGEILFSLCVGFGIMMSYWS
ncbi:hypothetical protein, partial [Priestia megaterium]